MTVAQNISKNKMLQALEKSHGIITTAAKMAGIDRITHWRWMQNDEDYRQKVKELEEVALDFAESKLYELIDEKNETSIIFYLKTKGKKRGYMQTSENIVRVDSIESMSDDELQNTINTLLNGQRAKNTGDTPA